MKNKLILAGIVLIIVIVVGFSVWVYWRSVDYSDKTKHDTDTWAVIKDSKGDIISVETTKPSVWENLDNLGCNQSEMWIGGIVEEYYNYWGFHFKPETIAIAQITIEGAQFNIQGISGDLNYWMNIWTKETYVLSKVIEIHE